MGIDKLHKQNDFAEPIYQQEKQYAAELKKEVLESKQTCSGSVGTRLKLNLENSHDEFQKVVFPPTEELRLSTVWPITGRAPRKPELSFLFPFHDMLLLRNRNVKKKKCYDYG